MALIGASLRVAAAAGLVAVGGWAASERVRVATWEVPDREVEVPTTPGAVARGAHLVRDVARCTACHGDDLGGASLPEGPGAGRWAPDLTPSGAGAWPVADLVRAIAHGVGRGGRPLLYMPSDRYAALGDGALGEVIAHLRSLPPASRAPVARALGWSDRRALLDGTAVAAARVAQRAPVAPMAPAPDGAWGARLAEVAGCASCHGGPPALPSNTTGARFAAAVTGGTALEGGPLAVPDHAWPGLEDLERDALWAWAREGRGP